MKAVIEGLLFLCGEDGLTIEQIAKITELDTNIIKQHIKELYNDYENSERGLQIELLGNHFKLTTKPDHKEYYKKLVTEEENSPLSEAALETLAIIAYNEPITRIEIDNIRGVNSIYVLRKLLLKGLIEEKGRAESAGKPRLYGTTLKFLDYFGLGSINELPKINLDSNDTADNEENLFNSRYTEEN